MIRISEREQVRTKEREEIHMARHLLRFMFTRIDGLVFYGCSTGFSSLFVERKDDTPLGFVSGWSRAAMVRAGYQACGIRMRYLELRSHTTFDLLHPTSSEATIS